MAKPIGVWGIDIGQCALKTLRCHMEGDTVVPDAFDYIEYPKILSQPESNPTELIKEALEQFLSRNDVRGDRVAISVPGQSGLARYFKPPPVDAKKIADIVKYEARQQIPFPLEDVIWDYQRMGGGTEVDGIALETEVGLFAMKRDQVYKALQPFQTAGIEVDIIQLAPLSIYNYVVYDLLEKTLPPPEQFDPEAPPPSTVVIAMGTDTTDLVVTNGYRVWQRNIPLGGNHFTKQLTKELKLTFAKAEHLKRNAHQAEDPKAVFQAMRPVFNDMVTELQRSLGYFQSLDRKAEISNVVVLGNTVKLPGLKQYLTKHLGYNVIEFEGFERLSGDAVTRAPAFRDNLLAFGVSYGLCLQGLEKGRLATNLLPHEITTERMIRAKKPWAVATAGAFLLACALNYMFHYVAWRDVHKADWEPSTRQVEQVVNKSKQFVQADEASKTKLDNLSKIGDEVIGSADRRLLWLELLKAVNESMPVTPGRKPGEILDPNKTPFGQQQELHVTQIESQYFPDLKTWFEGQGGAVKAAYLDVTRTEKPQPVAEAPAAPGPNGAAAPATNGATVPAAPGTAAPASPPGTPAPATTPATAPPVGTAVPASPPATTGPGPATTPAPAATGTTTTGDAASTEVKGPEGPGWVIELTGYHFYNDIVSKAGRNHVRTTLIKNLLEGEIDLPAGPGQPEITWTMKELGIGYPIFALNSTLTRNFEIPNPNFQQQNTTEGFSAAPGTVRPTNKAKKSDKNKQEEVEFWPATRYDFVVQFVWQEKPLSARLIARQKAKEEAAQLAADGAPVPETPDVAVSEPAAPVQPMPEPVAVEPMPAVEPAPAEEPAAKKAPEPPPVEPVDIPPDVPDAAPVVPDPADAAKGGE